MHSADEAATVLLLPEDSRHRCTWAYTGCRASRGLSLDGGFLGAMMIAMRMRIPEYVPRCHQTVCDSKENRSAAELAC